MKTLYAFIFLFAISTLNLSAAVTADLVITAPEGTDDPQSAADGGLNASYGRAQLNFIVKAGTGNVKLDSLATNSGVPEIKDWGDRLDVLGEESLPGSPLTFIPELDARVRITINALKPDGTDGRLKADNGRGFGVEGSNPHRVDWNVNNAASEVLKIDVDLTELPSTHRLDIVSLTLGNAGGGGSVGLSIPKLVDFSGGTLRGQVLSEEEASLFLLGSAHELKGGRFSSLYLSQASKPETGNAGFSLQGITLDILPDYGDWAGYYLADPSGNTDTRSLLGWVNVANPGWTWSYNFSAWFYVQEGWVTHKGSWAYMPAASELALGQVDYVGPDWIWVYSQASWVYRPGVAVTESGSWIFIFDL
jgi:hypothetical protein